MKPNAYSLIQAFVVALALGIGASPALAQAASISLPAIQEEDGMLCGPRYPLLSLQSDTAGAFEIAWSAFPKGFGMDFRTIEYRLRMTDPNQPDRPANFRYDNHLIPLAGGKPNEFDVVSEWVCADILLTTPIFSTKVSIPDSVRVGQKTPARTSRGGLETWVALTTEPGPTLNAPTLWAQVTHFGYPRVAVQDYLKQDWTSSRLYKVGAGKYELRLQRTETRANGVRFEHSLKVVYQQVCPGAACL